MTDADIKPNKRAHKPHSARQQPTYHGTDWHKWKHTDIDQLRAEQSSSNGEGDAHSKALLAVPKWAAKDARLRNS